MGRTGLDPLYFISIPYGAIKSHNMETLTACMKKISIPYGAIKSSSIFITNFDILEFQFLMVRLKE